MKPRLHLSHLKNSFILFSALAVTPAFAQEQQAKDSLKTLRINEVVVTGTRFETDRNKLPQKIEVITQEDIQLTPAQEFTDLLKKNSSVDIIQYPGLLSGVGIRGFRPQISGINQRALLLVDGRPAGTTNLSTISPSNIERIEVLKGPASALYGSQAMGGVINVITKKSSGQIQTSVFAEYGSFSSLKTGAATGGNITDRLDFDLAFQLFDRNEDIRLGKGNLFRNALNGDTYTIFMKDGTTEKKEDKRGDGERRDYTKLSYTTGNLRLGYKLSENWRIDIRGERFLARNVESPSDISYGNASSSTKDIERAKGEASISGVLRNHAISATAYLAEEGTSNNTLVASGKPTVPYRSFMSGATWKGLQVKDIISFSKHTLSLGIDHNNASYQSRAFKADASERAPYNPNYSLVSTAFYAQGLFNLLGEKLVITPGARFDMITYDVKATPLLNAYTPGKETNPFISPSLGMQYQITAPLKVHATVGRAFVTPDAYNVAGYSETVNKKKAAVTHGNPDLKNESSITWDAGLRYQKPSLGITADITYFSTSVKDRITRQTTNPATTELTANGDTIKSYTTFINANRGEISGLEYGLGYDLGALNDYRYSLRLFANATSNFEAKEITVNKDGLETSKDIYNVSRLTTSYGVEYNNLKGFTTRLSGRYVGHRKDTDFTDPSYPQIEYPAFMVLDLAASYTYARQHTLTLFVNNLTDENYYEKRGFNMPGRNIALRYSITF
jgi:vitamin B12 transporter